MRYSASTTILQHLYFAVCARNVQSILPCTGTRATAAPRIIRRYTEYTCSIAFDKVNVFPVVFSSIFGRSTRDTIKTYLNRERVDICSAMCQGSRAPTAKLLLYIPYVACARTRHLGRRGKRRHNSQPPNDHARPVKKRESNHNRHFAPAKKACLELTSFCCPACLSGQLEVAVMLPHLSPSLPLPRVSQSLTPSSCALCSPILVKRSLPHPSTPVAG